MIREELLQIFPNKRIKPVDGMAVTAEIWEEAHEFHRLSQQFHAMLNHGAGILTGLQVIASDPPDRSIYIMPGLAVDSWGQPVVLTEPLAYDVGHAVEGPLYILLTYGEGQPMNSGQDASSPLYISSHFGVEARPDWPTTPYVELARIRRQGRETPIFNAQHFNHPGPNELDLRYRREMGATTLETDSIAVVYLGGGTTDTRHGDGAAYMARAFTRSFSDKRVYVDHDISLSARLENYALIYLVGRGPFQLSPDESGILYNHIQSGGTLFIESSRRNVTEGDTPADASFFNLLGAMGLALTEVRTGDRLLTNPFLFGLSPDGFETQGSPRVLAGDGVIFSTFDYGALWQGETRAGPASREKIRAAMEFGANIVTYAMERRRNFKGGR